MVFLPELEPKHVTGQTSKDFRNALLKEYGMVNLHATLCVLSFFQILQKTNYSVPKFLLLTSIPQ